MPEFYSRIQFEGAAAIIRNRSHCRPRIGIILGSGLGEIADAVELPDTIPYDQIPHWPASTVEGHQGRLVLGSLQGHKVAVMQGRAHFYEGYSMNQLALPIRVMQMLGVEKLLITNAAGGLNTHFKVGDLMLLKDHLNLVGMSGHNPLRGPNESGPRFPDLTHAYDPTLQDVARSSARELGFTLKEGVYAFVSGPNYETPAELRFLKMIGADAVGMSTVPEVLIARQAGMEVLGISNITNLALTDPSSTDSVTHYEVIAAGKEAIPRLSQLIQSVLDKLPPPAESIW